MNKEQFSEACAAGFTDKQCLVLERLLEKSKTSSSSLLVLFFRAWFLYSIDLGLAITAWIIGFGLEVKNWWVIIGMGLIVRAVFHIVTYSLVRPNKS